MAIPKDIQDAINKLNNSDKLQTLEELQESLNEITHGYNHRPQPELFNLSPDQTHRLITSDWQSRESVLWLNDNLSLKDLEQAPILFNTRQFLTMLAEGPAKITAAGNLNRKFVSEFFSKMKIDPDELDLLTEINKVINEEDLQPLHNLRVVLTVAGLIRKNNGYFRITKKGIQLLSEEFSGKLFAYLFTAFFRKFNLAYLSWSNNLSQLQNNIAFSFYVIKNIADDWISLEELHDLIYLDPVRSEILDSKYKNYPLMPMEFRIIDPLISFGLLEVRKVQPSKLSGNHSIRKSPLFDRFVSFNFK